MEPTAPAAVSPRHPKFVRWALLIGTVVILNVFFNVLVSIVFPGPVYEAYCPTSQTVQSYDTQESCVASGGQWTNTPAKQPYLAPGLPSPVGYCDAQYTCRKSYASAQELYARNAFISFIVLGVTVLILGLLPIGSSIVSSGLSYGGVVALIIGSAEYWGTAGKWVRLVIATAGLLVLLYIGWRRFRD